MRSSGAGGGSGESFAPLDRGDVLRLRAGRQREKSRRAAMGQFMTPAPLARFMASLLDCPQPAVSLLDAGAGVGSLLTAAVMGPCRRPHPPESITVTAYEIDATLIGSLREALRLCHAGCESACIRFSGEIRQKDFIEDAVRMRNGSLFEEAAPRAFTCAILNPPYRKIRADSPARRMLRQIGVETSNLYTAFMAAAVGLLEPSGELVAVTPRSFCNGPYFKGFRRFFLREMRLRRLHLFASREEAFREDQVLQETVVLHAVKTERKAERICVTSSDGPEDDFILSRDLPYEEVVRPEDAESFIRIAPDDLDRRIGLKMDRFPLSLGDLGLSVSTGRVVDFRSRAFLRRHPGPGTAPLIYPLHLRQGAVSWPDRGGRKPNAIAVAEETESLLSPKGHYVLVRRFSSKEEKRRIVAALYDPEALPDERVGFENHLNYFHRDGQGLDPALAKGLALFLSSTLVDAYFRQFNGHTQVNAADLRSLKYPTAEALRSLASRADGAWPAQAEIDRLIERELLPMKETEGDDPVAVRRRIEEALSVLASLGLPRAQLNERSALTLLALLDLPPDSPWQEAKSPLRGITPIMDYIARHYGKRYKPNTRETVRRQTVYPFLDAGLAVANPDDPGRPINSPKTVCRIESSALDALKTYGTEQWELRLAAYLASVETLRQRYARERKRARLPASLGGDVEVSLSPGGQNVLVKEIIERFAPCFTPGGRFLYVGDADNKFAYFDSEFLTALGVRLDEHGKMPDVIIYQADKNWLVLIEAVTSHGPVNPKRREDLQSLSGASTAGLVFVTAFLDRKAMTAYLSDIAWETEVWIADSPTHLIHFDGEKFLGPY
ncbi:MAG: Eco57I restriction-modification methylase domain-containing protein [Armatimonadetes bacterium]|nr:Eco57I restriction-modification methylase domain-containing protein [Armatimonadota bacterium]